MNRETPGVNIVAPLQSDAGLLARNLDALAKRQPRVADQLAELAVPDSVQDAVGRDGAATFRLTQTDGRELWLGNSSMPTISSAALMAEFDPGTGNVLLPSIGHGGEVQCLLQRLRPHQAVFTCDTDPVIPALALRLHDFSTPIRNGRLIIALGSNVTSALQACLADYPTHLPPTRIFAAPQLRPTELYRLQVQSESAARRQHEHLQRSVIDFRSRFAKRQVEPGGGVLLLSLVAHPEILRVARALAVAGRRLELDVTCHTVDRPAHAHQLAALQRLDRCRPTEVVLLNQVVEQCDGLLDHVPRVRSLFVTPEALPPELAGGLRSGHHLFASGAALARQLQDFGPRMPEIRVLGPIVDDTVFHPVKLSDEDHARYAADIAVIMDGIDLSPRSLGLQWESHVLLVKTITQRLSRNPVCLDAQESLRVVDEACRRTAVSLEGTDVRRHLARLVRTRIAPTLTVSRIVRQLGGEFAVRLWGSHWESHGVDDVTTVAPRLSPTERNAVYAASSLILHARHDELDDQHLFEAVTAGACVVCQQSSPAADRDSQHPRQALPAFVTVEQAVTLLRALLEDSPERRAAKYQRAQSLIAKYHHSAQRLQALLGNS